MLRLLIDEDFNQRILRGLKRLQPGLDHALVQDAGLEGAADPLVLARAAELNRVLVTHDLKTMPKHAYARVQTGQAMAGVIAVPKRLSIGMAVEELHLIVECCEPSEFIDRVLFLPLDM
jgi:hypothetical protein